MPVPWQVAHRQCKKHILMLKVCSRPHWVKYLHLNSHVHEYSEFVQVLNISRSHWVTVSNIGCQSGCVMIYDSLPNCDVPTALRSRLQLFAERYHDCTNACTRTHHNKHTCMHSCTRTHVHTHTHTHTIGKNAHVYGRERTTFGVDGP